MLGCGLDTKPRGKVWGLKEDDGKVAFALSFPHDMQTSSPIVQSDGTFLIGSVDARLYCIDSVSGKTKWQWRAGRGIWATPAIGSDGTIYVGSHDEKVYALEYDVGKDEV